jgi:hypothetical protein
MKKRLAQGCGGKPRNQLAVSWPGMPWRLCLRTAGGAGKAVPRGTRTGSKAERGLQCKRTKLLSGATEALPNSNEPDADGNGMHEPESLARGTRGANGFCIGQSPCGPLTMNTRHAFHASSPPHQFRRKGRFRHRKKFRQALRLLSFKCSMRSIRSRCDM